MFRNCVAIPTKTHTNTKNIHTIFFLNDSFIKLFIKQFIVYLKGGSLFCILHSLILFSIFNKLNMKYSMTSNNKENFSSSSIPDHF